MIRLGNWLRIGEPGYRGFYWGIGPFSSYAYWPECRWWGVCVFVLHKGISTDDSCRPMLHFGPVVIGPFIGWKACQWCDRERKGA